MLSAPRDGSQASEVIVFQRKNHSKRNRNHSLKMLPTKSEHVLNDAGTSCQYQALDCRSFWKAGCDDASAVPFHTQTESTESSEFERARVHPKFLHSNATSHTWAFGAMAELLDNAVDEICNGASFIKVDKISDPRDGSPVLVFHDNGGGMDPEGIRRCMSLGFSSKKTSGTIGQYGNGFKTSTMRLGADAIVFTRSSKGSCSTQSVGLLSYTYLIKTMKNDIVVPIVDFNFTKDQVQPLVYASQVDWDNDLNILVDWSPFTSKDKIMEQFADIGSSGTKIMVYNLWFDDDGRLELEFDYLNDIRLRDNVDVLHPSSQAEVVKSHISCAYRYSLRAYFSILYLKKYADFQIILRGEPVQHLNLADEMKFIKTMPYRPFIGMEESVATTIGFTKEAPVLGTFGFNIYHKNRLIVAFCKPIQEGSNRGRCVIGFLEANFLEPAHDKQDFERSPLFHRLEMKLRQMMLEYWKTHYHLLGYKSPNLEMQTKRNETNPNRLATKHKTFQNLSTTQPTAGIASLQQSLLDGRPIGCIATEMVTELPQYGVSMVNSTAASGLCSDIALTPSPHENKQAYSDSFALDKLTKENVKLSVRHEECKGRQEILRKQIEKLEAELEEFRRKRAKLVMEIKLRNKKQS